MENLQKIKKTQKNYNDTFRNKYKDIKFICDICGKEYTYYAKSKHIKSKYHTFADNVLYENKILHH
jgi:hypothetical protein